MSEYESEWNPEEDDEEEEEEMLEDEESNEYVSSDEADEDDDELLDELEEDLLVKEALLEFSFKFSEYIKEIDPELWKRAVDYAVTFTKVDGVEFFSEIDKGQTGNSDTPPTT